MSSASPEDPLLAHTGSSEAAGLLRSNLSSIADQHRGTAMARAIHEVLSGRRDLSALEADPDFMRLMRSGVTQYEEHVAALSPEEKDRLYAEAAEILEAQDPGER